MIHRHFSLFIIELSRTIPWIMPQHAFSGGVKACHTVVAILWWWYRLVTHDDYKMKSDRQRTTLGSTSSSCSCQHSFGHHRKRNSL